MFDPGAEFDRQVRTLLEQGYPDLAGMPEEAFAARVAPLRAKAVARAGDPPTDARVPFVLVIDKALAPADRVMRLTARNGRPGFADFDPDDLGRFEPINRFPTGRPIWRSTSIAAARRSTSHPMTLWSPSPGRVARR